MIFKSIDDKIEDLGFRLITDNKCLVIYERFDKKYNYRQVVSLCHKESGKHILQSYDPDLFDNKNIGNTCVGLTYKETKLFLKKMRKKGWK